MNNIRYRETMVHGKTEQNSFKLGRVANLHHLLFELLDF